MTGEREQSATPRIRLLVITGATGHEQGGTVYLPSEQVERFRALPQRFDTTLVVKRSTPRPGNTTPLPADIRVTWIEAYRSKWHLLLPRHLLGLRHEVRRAHAVMTLMPLLDGISPLVLALLARRPRYVYVIANSIHFRSPIRGGRVARLAARVVLNACASISTRVFVHGIGLAEELWEPVARKTTEIILSTISGEDFMPPERDESGRLEVLCVSRLVPSKRVDVAVEMTRILLDRGVDARLTVVGHGPLRDDLANRARLLSLGDHVVFTGFVDDRQQLRHLYRRSHIFVLPTEMEGISMAIQEAMAAGIPVVSTHAGALAQFLHHGIDSIVVEGSDPAAFADAVGQLAASRELRLQIGRAGQQKVAQLDNAAWVTAVANLLEADLHG